MKYEITELNLTVKTYNVLKRAHITYLEELCEKTAYEAKKIRNLGPKSYREIVNEMNDRGLKFKKETL